MKLAPAPYRHWLDLITRGHTICLYLFGQQCLLCSLTPSVCHSVVSPRDATWEETRHWSSLAEDIRDASILDRSLLSVQAANTQYKFRATNSMKTTLVPANYFPAHMAKLQTIIRERLVNTIFCVGDIGSF